MADSIVDTTSAGGLIENATETITNEKIPSTPEGMVVAYGSLIVMAMLPIFFGAARSVKHQKQKKDSGEKPENMSSKDAMMFPIIASGALFGLYLLFKIFSKDYINMLLTGYFFVLGVLALAHLINPVVCSLMPASIPKKQYHFWWYEIDGKNKDDIVNYKFTSHDVICLILSALIGVWYLYKKHWIANNLFGLAFSVNGVEMLHLNNVVTGCILLCGLFVYDIFWVFGTNVMVTVAKSFEAPIKLVFPQDILTNGWNASNFAMLGLGDIVVPGIFIALLLRFDNSLKRKVKLYFYSTFTAYFLGLLATIFVMHVFKHAQPALLYLVPACLLTPILIAILKGDLKRLFAYEDNPDEKAKQEKAEKEGSSNNKEKESSSNKKKDSKKVK